MQLPQKAFLFSNHLFSLLTVNQCPLCKRAALSYPNQLICYKCRPSLQLRKVCYRCGRFIELNSDEPIYECRYCRSFKLYYQQARSLALYEEKWRDVIKTFKVHPGGVLLNQLSGMLRRHLMSSYYSSKFDCIVPVPQRRICLGTVRQHPASLLAKKLAQKTNLHYKSLLTFTRRTKKQHELQRDQRLKNMNNAVICKNAINPKDRFLIIDDVFTTGATVNECSRALKKAGATMIGVLTLARGKDRYNSDNYENGSHNK